MSITRSISHLLGATVAVAFIAGCGSAFQTYQPATSSVQASRLKTWISPDAKDAPVLFFQGDVDLGNIYIFSLPEMTLKGTISGLSEPLGMCSDLAGNIYVAEAGLSRVDEFTRAGTLIATFTDTYGYPSACAVNPQNGYLAVTDTSSPLKVLVFSSPSSPPTALIVPDMTYLSFAGYNDKGELWVDGFNYLDFALSRCDASECKRLNVRGAQYFEAGTVQWDDVRKTWVIFDQSCDSGNPGSCSYPVSERGVLGEQTSYNNYKDAAVCSLKQAVIGAYKKRFVVGGDWDYDTCGGPTGNAVYRWAYPAGGDPTNYAVLPNGARPYGAAISTK
jgi:DNA-binding beta-propeller fold protein YncE